MLFNSNFIGILFLLLFLGIGILSYILFKTIANYNRLTKGVTVKTLTELLNDLLKEEKLNQIELNKVLTKMEELDLEAKRHIQKIGYVRFNPFTDTGGDQSFSLALMDGVNNGAVLTSLYSRTGVRWYIKSIKNGKGVEHDLSKEEKEAIIKASTKH